MAVLPTSTMAEEGQVGKLRVCRNRVIPGPNMVDEATCGAEQAVLYANVVLVDYSLSNSDTLTKYKTAARIAHQALETVTGKMIFGTTLC